MAGFVLSKIPALLCWSFSSVSGMTLTGSQTTTESLLVSFGRMETAPGGYICGRESAASENRSHMPLLQVAMVALRISPDKLSRGPWQQYTTTK